MVVFTAVSLLLQGACTRFAVAWSVRVFITGQELYYLNQEHCTGHSASNLNGLCTHSGLQCRFVGHVNNPRHWQPDLCVYANSCLYSVARIIQIENNILVHHP